MRQLELATSSIRSGSLIPGRSCCTTTLNHCKIRTSNGELIDLSVVDIVRDRRRGIPRYNNFRAALGLPRLRDWEGLSADPITARKLRDIYRKLDMVDTMIGLFAEPPPAGLASAIPPFVFSFLWRHGACRATVS